MKVLKEGSEMPKIQSLREVFITRKEVAEELQCSLSYVDNLRRSGFLKSYSIGRLVRFKREEIIDAIDQAQNSRM